MCGVLEFSLFVFCETFTCRIWCNWAFALLCAIMGWKVVFFCFCFFVPSHCVRWPIGDGLAPSDQKHWLFISYILNDNICFMKLFDDQKAISLILLCLSSLYNIHCVDEDVQFFGYSDFNLDQHTSQSYLSSDFRISSTGRSNLNKLC